MFLQSSIVRSCPRPRSGREISLSGGPNFNLFRSMKSMSGKRKYLKYVKMVTIHQEEGGAIDLRVISHIRSRMIYTVVLVVLG